MFFALTEDQQEFGSAVTTYLAERFDTEAVRGVFEDESGDGNPASLWKAAGEQGWLAVTVPEEHDGLGLGLIEAQVIARALDAELFWVLLPAELG
ncbi:acyl-CoA dehydrogenase family protein, partial [Pseudonocardia pini]|uniref:acyl-CoA dehydrogenase family protein n=1 Tax=Pseudonocardia pini TaxID=2758030 RepID=UPI0015F0841B